MAFLSVASFQKGENILSQLKSVEAKRAGDFEGNYTFFYIFNQEHFLTFPEEVWIVSEFPHLYKGDTTNQCTKQGKPFVCLASQEQYIVLAAKYPSSNLRPLLGWALSSLYQHVQY